MSDIHAEPQVPANTPALPQAEQPTPAPEPQAPEPQPEPQPEEGGRRPNRHDDQIAALVAKRHERMRREQDEAVRQGLPAEPPQNAVETPSLDPAQSTAQPQPAPQAPVAPQPQPAQPASAQPPGQPEPVRVHKIRVRGRELDVPDEDFRRAAELGFETELRRIEAARQTPQPQPSASPSPAPVAPPAQQQPPSGLDLDAAREVAREHHYGDENKAAEAILKLAKSSQGQAIDPNQIAEQAAAAAMQRIQLQNGIYGDLNTFASEFPDVAKDEALATIAGNYVRQARQHYQQNGMARSELDLYREAGRYVTEKLTSWRGPGQEQPQPQPAAAPAAPSNVVSLAPQQQRTTIKRNMPQAPSAASARQAPAQTAPPTGTDIVNDMRRSRGQAPIYKR
jgi:hypothetical protein